LIPFQITKSVRQISQDLPVRKILEIAEIGGSKTKLKECIDNTVKQNASLWTEIVWNFAPLGESAKRVSMDLSSRKSSSRLSEMPAVAFAKMAPLIICARFNPISCFP